MALITGTSLDIEAAPSPTRGRRRLQVRYTFTVDGAEPIAGRAVDEHIVVRAVDRHDAPVGPRPGPVLEVTRRFTATAGAVERVWEGDVARIDLDVEKDWWAPSLDGRPIPIAELVDHLEAEVAVLDGSALVARATSPVVSGSWGVLGHS